MILDLLVPSPVRIVHFNAIIKGILMVLVRLIQVIIPLSDSLVTCLPALVLLLLLVALVLRSVLLVSVLVVSQLRCQVLRVD